MIAHKISTMKNRKCFEIHQEKQDNSRMVVQYRRKKTKQNIYNLPRILLLKILWTLWRLPNLCPEDILIRALVFLIDSIQQSKIKPEKDFNTAPLSVCNHLREFFFLLANELKWAYQYHVQIQKATKIAEETKADDNRSQSRSKQYFLINSFWKISQPIMLISGMSRRIWKQNENHFLQSTCKKIHWMPVFEIISGFKWARYVQIV